MPVARLHEGALVLSEDEDGQVVGDFRLRLTTPDGEETWSLGGGPFGPIADFAGKGLSVFDVQARSWFTDHMHDLEMRGLEPDRSYDELPVSYDVNAELREILEG